MTDPVTDKKNFATGNFPRGFDVEYNTRFDDFDIRGAIIPTDKLMDDHILKAGRYHSPNTKGAIMAKYVDGYVIPVPKEKLRAYLSMAKKGGKVWMKHGALAYFECVGDDLNPKMMDPVTNKNLKVPSFPQIVKAKPNETVIFSFIVYKSRAHRDKVNAKVFSDPSMNDPKNMVQPMPFDMKRMVWGGFKTIVSI